MNIVKGFISIPNLSNNGIGAVASFGELSTYASTFSRNKQNYTLTTKPDVELVTFKSVDGTNVYTSIPLTVSTLILSIAQWVYDEYEAEQIPLNTSLSTFITGLGAQFPTISDIEINELVAGPSAVRNMPDYIQFEHTDVGPSIPYTVKIWFNDSRFRAQYDEFEILVVPPIQPLDDLDDTTAVVGLLLQNTTANYMVSQMNLLIGTNPPTKVDTRNYTWHDPTAPASTIPSTWGIVIYGLAGDTPDNIRLAVQQYITDNGTGTNWPIIYPDIYTENEFIIVPLWENIAAPTTVLQYGIYSPTAKVSDLNGIAELLIPDSYETLVVIATYLNLNLNVSSAFYRSLAFVALGNPNNAGGITTFATRYPDYMNVPTSSLDFARMALPTQNFALKFNDALDKAFNMTPTSPVPATFSRVVKDGNKVYVAFEMDGTTFLVLSKHTYNALA